MSNFGSGKNEILAYWLLIAFFPILIVFFALSIILGTIYNTDPFLILVVLLFCNLLLFFFMKNFVRRNLRKKNELLIIFCNECGKRVSKEDSRCQNCGEELPIR
jgi:ABC-type transport system involved in Fe-S cluster assembly fused permease/ATPase subunit